MTPLASRYAPVGLLDYAAIKHIGEQVMRLLVRYARAATLTEVGVLIEPTRQLRL
ncbi:MULTISPECIES: hypothetical protein [unclassified Devosia]|uniref:hypothetical protein n=1 Tax=unclassified Devosia TaxID=196773 RepID=UPI0025BEEDBB|nr:MULTISPECIES: hypothetical protein [unclassified Devosia]